MFVLQNEKRAVSRTQFFTLTFFLYMRNKYLRKKNKMDMKCSANGRERGKANSIWENLK
jgi:hypothetical protein